MRSAADEAAKPAEISQGQAGVELGVRVHGANRPRTYLCCMRGGEPIEEAWTNGRRDLNPRDAGFGVASSFGRIPFDEHDRHPHVICIQGLV